MFILFLIICQCVFVSTCILMPAEVRGFRFALELESQVFVRYLLSMLGAKLGSSAKSATAPTCWAVSPDPGLGILAVLSLWVLFLHSVRPSDELGLFLCSPVQKVTCPLLPVLCISRETFCIPYPIFLLFVTGEKTLSQLRLIFTPNAFEVILYHLNSYNCFSVSFKQNRRDWKENN